MGGTMMLNDGRVGVVRPMQDADEAQLLDLDERIHTRGQGTLLSLQEALDRPLVMQVRRRGAEGTDSMLFVAEIEGVVAGEVMVLRRELAALRHVAGISVEVNPDYQGAGIGRALLEAAVSWARDPEHAIHRLELGVRADNPKAIHLLETLGFKIEGTKRDFMRLPSGAFVDIHKMSLLI